VLWLSGPEPTLPRAAALWARRILVKAMLKRLRTRWREARGTRLRRQFENASLYVRDLGNEQAERFSRGLNYLFNDWVERFGPVKECEVRVRQHTVKEMRRDARLRYERDIAAAYALEFLSYHVEASYLPGEDAAFVYDLTSHYISRAGDAARRMRDEPHQNEGGSDSSAF
jgi:hypothetical protein